MDVLLESCRDNILDYTLFDLVIPMIVNLPQLLIHILLLLLLDLLDHAVLLLDELRNLRLLIVGISLRLNLGLQLLNRGLKLLYFLPELLVLILEIKEQFLVIDLLRLERAQLCLFLGKFNADLLIKLLKFLTIAFLNGQDLLQGLNILLQLRALFFLFQDLMSHLLNHSLILQKGLILHLYLGQLLFLSIEFFEEYVHVDELLLINLNQLLLAFLIFDLFLHIQLLILKILSQTGDGLSKFSVLLFQLVCGQ